MTINIGVIGLGAMGVRLIKELCEHPEIRVEAVCDTNPERAEMMMEMLGNVSFNTDYKEMLHHEQFDLVYVAVPPKFHHQVVMGVIKTGTNVLCEKPLANSVEEAKEMYEKASKAGIIHAMNFPLNYEAGPNTFMKLLKENYVGKVRKVELMMHFPEWPRRWQQNNWVASREQGGFALEVGVHFIQLTQRIFGSIQNIHSTLELPNNLNECETGIIAHAELDGEIPLLINGISHVAGDERIAYTVYGTDGTLSLVNWADVEGAKIGDKIKPISSSTTSVPTLIDNLIAALKGEDSQLYTFLDGYQAQLVLEKLRKKG